MQERAQKTRTRILCAATELFSQRGLNGATVDGIAAAAGVNKQRIYAYFTSKNKLFEAVLLDVFERVELFSEKTLAKAERHPEKITEIVADGFLKVHAAHPDFWRLLAWANLEGPHCTDTLDHARKKENERLRILHSRAVADGLIRPVSFEAWLYTLLAVTYFRYSNELTISRTLSCIGPLRDFESSLVRELNNLFTMGMDKR